MDHVLPAGFALADLALAGRLRSPRAAGVVLGGRESGEFGVRVWGRDGLRVVVDCAQGSASELAQRVLRAAGAEVTALFADGDGNRRLTTA